MRTLVVIACTLALTACEPTFDYGAKKYEVKRLQTNLAAQPCNQETFVSLAEVMSEAGDSAGVTALTDAFTSKCGPLPWTPWLTFDYGARLPKVKSLAQALAKEPCDKGRMVQLLDEMVGAGDYRGTLTKADAFFAACGDLPRARWLTYEAHKRLSEYELAAAEATKLIESDKYDRDFWWWRGNAWALKGDHDKALADFREVHKLCPECTVGWQIADAAEKLGRPCEGIAALEQVATHHPDARDIDDLRRRVASLRALPSCGGVTAPVAATDERAPGRRR